MIRRMFLWICLVSLISTPFGSAGENADWRAGSAKVVITPPHLMWMSGYGSRDKPAEGKVHDLWAKALALKAPDGKRLVLVSLDLVGIDRDLSVQICADLGKQFGFQRAEICLACSHTHCGPVVHNNLDVMYFLDAKQRMLVDDYARFLHRQVVEVVGSALKDLAPARVESGNGLVTFATNRRNNKEADVPKLRDQGLLKGPVDHDVPVLAVRAPDGKVRAIAFGYACHATVLSFFQWCGDYPGFAMEELERQYPGANALFFAGCGADQNPLPRRTVELAQKYGMDLAQGVVDVLQAPMTPLRASIRAQYQEIDLALADLPSREHLVKEAESKDKFIAARAKVLLNKLTKSGSLAQNYPYPIQTWNIGQLRWITLGGEVVVDYSVRLKKELGPVWVAGYCNDVMAYIPSLRVLKEGGYEGASSMVYYGLPTVWSPRVEETIIQATRRQAGE